MIDSESLSRLAEPGARDAAPPKPANDLEAMCRGVNDAAVGCGAVWLPFLLFQFSLAFSVWSVSHVDLFLERTLKVPAVNIELPLPAFFCLAPALLLILHAYMLTLFVILAERADRLRAMMREIETVGAGRCEDLRRQLSSNIFVQYLLGPSALRAGAFGWALRIIAWVSLGVGPILLLLGLQARFLPFQSAPITLLHLGALALDLALLHWLWSKAPTTDRSCASARVARVEAWTGATAMVLAIVFSVAMAADAISPQPFLPALNRLVLTDENIAEIAGAPANKAEFVYRARGRQFRGARFERAILTRIDFQGAHLDGAWFQAAQLDGANFDEATMEDAFFDGATARGASFEKAHLAHADFDGADLAGADFAHADLIDAKFESAGVRGALFLEANLTKASLFDAKIFATSFHLANMSKAHLEKAEVVASDFSDAQLNAATLTDWKPNASDFSRTQHEGEGLRTALADLFAKQLCIVNDDNAYIKKGAVFSKLKGDELEKITKYLMSGECATSESLSADDRVALRSLQAQSEETRASSAPIANGGEDEEATLSRLSHTSTVGGFPTTASMDK